MPDTDKIKPPSCWVPMNPGIDLAALGKLGEELGEASAAVARCIIQGVDGLDPETGEPNRIWLQKELTDVQALTEIVIDRLKLDRGAMLERRVRKRKHKLAWFKLLTDKFGWV